MKVSLGTIEINDAARKGIRRDFGKSGQATREDVKEYLGAVIEAALKNAGSGVVKPMTGSQGDTLPEPTAGGSATGTTTTSTAGGGTTPSTGNLGSAGTPGGTV